MIGRAAVHRSPAVDRWPEGAFPGGFRSESRVRPQHGPPEPPPYVCPVT